MIEIEKPNIETVDISEDGRFGRFVVEPLERGYGTTLGNSLRRVLLSSIPGAAVVSRLRPAQPAQLAVGNAEAVRRAKLACQKVQGLFQHLLAAGLLCAASGQHLEDASRASHGKAEILLKLYVVHALLLMLLPGSGREACA